MWFLFMCDVITNAMYYWCSIVYSTALLESELIIVGVILITLSSLLCIISPYNNTLWSI